MVGDAVERVEDHGVGIRVACGTIPYPRHLPKCRNVPRGTFVVTRMYVQNMNWRVAFIQTVFPRQCLALSSQFTAQTRTLSQISSAASKKAERGGAVAGF